MAVQNVVSDDDTVAYLITFKVCITEMSYCILLVVVSNFLLQFPTMKLHVITAFVILSLHIYRLLLIR